MIVIPAVDLREGACVQLVGGSYADERVRLSDPVSVARGWASAGFHRLHLVDLDAATGTGSNLGIVEDILRDGGVGIQVGGGVRSTRAVEHLFQSGAERVVVGTRALEEPEWLANLAELYPDVIVVATDVRERRVVTRGWIRTLPFDILDVVEQLASMPLAALLVTAVHLEGQMRGPDLNLMEDVVEASHCPVIASGGVASMDDLHALEHRGIAGVVVGMALYSGALDPVSVVREFSE